MKIEKVDPIQLFIMLIIAVGMTVLLMCMWILVKIAPSC